MAAVPDCLLVSAPGKIILTGEHAVVYGRPALVAPLQRRTYVFVEPDPNLVSLIIDDLKVKAQWSLEEVQRLADEMSRNKEIIMNMEMHMSAKAFLYSYAVVASNNEVTGMRVKVKSNLILGAGLGSSASFSVSLSAALLLAMNQIKTIDAETLPVINDYAFQLETLFHGRPSGADNTTCCYGNVRYYDKSAGSQGHQFVENLELDLLVVNTRVERSTKTMVANVRAKYDANQDEIESVLNVIAGISDETFSLLQKLKMASENSVAICEKLNELFITNQKALETLGVSHDKIERVCALARRFGFGCKLTGAGGGGCAFILIPPGCKESVEALGEALNDDEQVDWFLCKVGGAGVRIEDPKLWDSL